jgi:hypothetical protein
MELAVAAIHGTPSPNPQTLNAKLFVSLNSEGEARAMELAAQQFTLP